MDPGSRAFLEAEGFEGFFTAGQLHAELCAGIPNLRGAYALLRDAPGAPEFVARGTAPLYRGMDPNRPIVELEERWVPGAQVLFYGAAGGPGVRSLLRQRVKRLLRFGHGRVVGHWSGRLLWQLRDATTLRVAWRPTGEEDPAAAVAELIARFQERYCALPFANATDEAGD